MSTHLIDLIHQLRRRRVLLLGDVMLDRYLYGNAERLSPEAPVPVLHYQREETGLGGAGRVAAGITALGGECRFITIVGNDDAGRQATQLLKDNGTDTTALLTVASRPTICKVRLIGLAQHRHPQQLIRLDYENASPIDDTLAQQIIAQVKANLQWAQVLCIEDYNKGLVTEQVCRQAIQLAKAKGIPVLVDPGPIADFAKYTGASVIKPNRPETAKASGLVVNTPEQYPVAGEWLLDRLQLEASLITLDKEGVYLATNDGQRQWIRGRERRVYDVTGAGDMVLATLCLARAAGASWQDAATLANTAGGLECEKFGSIPITPQELIQEILMETRQHLGKQRTLEQLLPELQQHRAAGKSIVFTNGCFDLIHLGHVKYFQFAKAQGDLLVVGVNTDSSIKRLKGDKRPIINEDDRLAVLEELESIDYLVRFDDDTPMQMIQAIRPDVLVKGADYQKHQVVGADFVESQGGRLALAPLIDGKSTSSIVQRILDTCGK